MARANAWADGSWYFVERSPSEGGREVGNGRRVERGRWGLSVTSEGGTQCWRLWLLSCVRVLWWSVKSEVAAL